VSRRCVRKRSRTENTSVHSTSVPVLRAADLITSRRSLFDGRKTRICPVRSARAHSDSGPCAGLLKRSALVMFVVPASRIRRPTRLRRQGMPAKDRYLQSALHRSDYTSLKHAAETDSVASRKLPCCAPPYRTEPTDRHCHWQRHRGLGDNQRCGDGPHCHYGGSDGNRCNNERLHATTVLHEVGMDIVANRGLREIRAGLLLQRSQQRLRPSLINRDVGVQLLQRAAAPVRRLDTFMSMFAALMKPPG